MLENPIHRDYVRTDSWSVIATARRDGDAEHWFDVRIPNIAAGGMLFLAEGQYEIGEDLWFDLQIDPMTPGITAKIPMKVKGEIKSYRGEKDGLHSYSVEFTEILKSDRIRLDELVRKTSYQNMLGTEGSIFDR